ncbi:hypothetical protein TMLG_03621, partial [Mycobacterium tuberculosis SUMu012]
VNGATGADGAKGLDGATGGKGNNGNPAESGFTESVDTVVRIRSLCANYSLDDTTAANPVSRVRRHRVLRLVGSLV